MDGALRWLDLAASFELARDGAPIRMIGVLADITERKQVEEKLRESQERLQIFIEHAPVPLAMFDREMRYLAASRRWKTDYRLGDRDVRGQSHYALFPEIPERWKAVHRRTLEGEIVRADEDRFVRADGLKFQRPVLPGMTLELALTLQWRAHECVLGFV